MRRWSRTVAAAVWILLTSAAGAEHGRELTEDAFAAASGRLGVIVLEINWGRQWNCGEYENAQLQRLTFAALSRERRRPEDRDLDFKTPSRLLVDNEFTPMAVMVEPGTYALSGFDIKLARSMSDVGHYVGTENELLPDGDPQGGIFSIKAGEIIYIGHFGLDCGPQIIPWRYYLTERADFAAYVEGFREVFPFTASTAVEFRLFETETIGTAFALADPVVPGED